MVHDVEVKTVPLADYAVPRAGLGEPIGCLVEALLKGTGAGKGEIRPSIIGYRESGRTLSRGCCNR
jgi:hypothetical protein